MVYIFLADGFEEIEGLTVVDLLRRAEITISMVSVTEHLEIKGAHDIRIKADHLFEEFDYKDADALVLPGGMPGTKHLSEHKGLVELLVEHNKQGKLIGAICAAPSVLGMNGILKGKKATCFPGFEDQLIGAEFVNETCVTDQNIVTSKGLGTAIDFSLELITEIKGKEEAVKIGKTIQYLS